MPDVVRLRGTLTLDAKDFEKAVKDADRSFKGLGRTADAEGRRVGIVGAAMAKAGHAAGAGIAAGARTAAAALTHLGSVARSTTGAISGAAGAARNFALVGSGALAASLGALAKRGVDVNLSVTGAEKAIGRIAGSAQLGKQFIAALRKEAETSSGTFKDMLIPAQALAAVFIEKYGQRGLGRVIPTLRAFADAAATLSLGDEARQLALMGFQQLVSEPDPSLENLRQVSDNLPGGGVRSIVRAAFGTDESEVLKKAGVTGAMVGDAIVRGLQARFGGAQKSAAGSLPTIFSNIQDALDSISGKVTEVFGQRLGLASKNLLDFATNLERTAVGKQLLKTLSDGFTSVANAVGYLINGFQAYTANLRPFIETVLAGVASLIRGLADLAANRAFIDGLAAGFQAVGNVLRFVVGQAGSFAAWLGEIINRNNVIEFLSRVAALFTTVGERVLKLVGIDFGRWLDPTAVVSFFDRLYAGVEEGIRFMFALGRVGQEVLRIIQSGVQDVQDAFRDFTQDAGTWIRRLFEDFQYQQRKAALDFGATFQNALGALLRRIQTVMNIFAQIPTFANALGLNEKNLKKFSEGIEGFFAESPSDAIAGVGAAIAQRQDPVRQALERDRNKQLGQRIIEDYRRDSGRLIRGLERFNEDPRRGMNPLDRIRGAFSGAFGKADEEGFFGDLARRREQFRSLFTASPASPAFNSPNPGSVTIVPQIPAVPYAASAMTPPSYSADQIYQQQRGAGLVFTGPVNIGAGMNLRDPQVRQDLRRQFEAWLDQLARTGGVSSIEPGF